MKSLLLLVSCLGAVVLSGCVSTVDGRHQAGVSFSQSKVTARYERPPADIWVAAKDVLKFNGVLTREDVLQATLEGAVDNKKVLVKVEPDDPKYTKVTVQARTSSGGGDVALAAEIDKQIAIRLATGNLTPAARSSGTQAPK